ncbi:hypothetical protein K503DRAFT_858771 [Rhizopogon vinicolor AM-OR11-026]|uniref:Uncharacterized protein n=1 Tax=Rhizopogon vinicolor AM-OR11-026 TaxID=1314800 RepID=A0A1B7MRF8_9AGAM|nr:hypothetical protein K503DRAFT_858771 [Rhizopogon vinicolor AM-OR11-026]
MSCPASDLLDSLPAEASQQLKEHANQVLLDNAPILATFREAIAQDNSKDDIEFLRQFRALVPVTSYEPYKPFVAKEVDVKDMFAPGLPYFLAIISAASRKEPKLFPRYRPPPQYLHHAAIPIPSSESTNFVPSSLKLSKFSKVLKIDLEDGQSSQSLAVGAASSGAMRMLMNWDFERDMDRLDLWASRMTAMYFLFADTFVSVMHYIEDEWLLLVDCIENGIILDIETRPFERSFESQAFIDDFMPVSSQVLSETYSVNLVRATELQKIKPPGEAEAGQYGLSNAKRLLDQLTCQQPQEYLIGVPYHSGNPTIDFKVTLNDGLIEFVDVLSDEPSDPTWRYRLGDAVAVKGFALDDGMPVINYVHRRGESGSSLETCTESELTSAIISTAKQWIGQIRGFIVVRDERKIPYASGFLVEIEGEIGNDAIMAPQNTSELLVASSFGYRYAF